jgi:AraC family transcriptional regulator of adaptative response/methylated-DNA-[protein]-cysteine methyltransferase
MDLLIPPRPASKKDCYAVFETKDLRFDGALFLGVSTTGIFCRPGCPARLPKFENCYFFDSAAEALTKGYRACKRCHAAGGESALIRNLITLVEDSPDMKLTDAALIQRGLSPATARRQFLRWVGMSFKDYARARRLARASETLEKGGSVLDAQLDAGFDSASGFRSAYAKLFGTPPSKKHMDPLFIEWLETPMGRMIAIADEAALYLLEFTNRKNMRRQFDRLRRIQSRAVLPGRTAITDQIETELSDYFAGKLEQFKTPLATSGTEFQRETWAALQNIPHGETRSYAQLAEMIGRPAAVRAVASANANNGLALIIPCHRVISKNGGLGGYAGGLTRKQDLLDLESKAGSESAEH